MRHPHMLHNDLLMGRAGQTKVATRRSPNEASHNDDSILRTDTTYTTWTDEQPFFDFNKEVGLYTDFEYLQ